MGNSNKTQVNPVIVASSDSAATRNTPVQHPPDTAVAITPMRERLASLKAGLLGGLSALLIWGSTAYVSRTLLQLNLSQVILATGIAAFSGFLFGLTYRYIVRHDRNPHLKSGAVGAFVLVRGLAQVEPWLLAHTTSSGSQLSLNAASGDMAAWPGMAVQWNFVSHWPLILLLLGQNWLMFVGTRWLIDFSFDRGWLQRFPIDPGSVVE